MNDLPCGYSVYFDNGVVKGWGKIAGIASIAQPILGVGYIVEIAESNKTEYYPYTHIVVHELYINKRKSKIKNINGKI